ncbi:hypothetical protein EGH21_22440 [Halomicroarcula sp. F13]|uniref:Uncharacterized protein n=1 Tax=Haloarcula rubra TaxID=2487747 RepID=A0AAW4PWV9_9EURY|nr:hypothetical protein [Halomicroarcula rubra]MBX0325780.1 hypothetical protein [Halomicroarcula rubra]
MTRRSPASKQMQSDFAERFADEFDEAPLHNKVWDDLGEDDQLARLCDAAAMADAAADLRVSYLGEDVDHLEPIEEAEGTLGWVARQRAVEAVAEVCATLIQDGDQWVEEGHWEQTTIDGAKQEAREWLQTHTTEAERVGALEVL